MSKNYHIAALGGGVLVLAGLGYLGYSASQKAEEQLAMSLGPQKTDTAVELGELAAESYQSVKEVEEWKPASVSGRVLNLLTSVDLFVKRGEIDSAIDIIEQPPVHDPIENQWWVVNGVDPGFADSPQRDHDGDGYTNEEEYDAETNPADDKSYPALVHKLEVVKIDTTKWVGILNSAFGNNDLQFRLRGLTPDGKRIESKMKAVDNVGIGGVFFEKGPFQNRFKVVEIKELVKEKRGIKSTEKYAVVEDLKANKKGQEYDFFFRLREREEILKNQQYDDVVHFQLNALGQAGKISKVETNTSFTIKADGKTLEYKLLEVKRGEDREPEFAVVEYTKPDGSKATREVPVR